MDAMVFLQKNKNTILNVGIVILALIISIKSIRIRIWR